jgi:hypothetical protein
MALRLIEMVLRQKDGGEVRVLLKEHKVLEHRQVRLPDGEALMRILLDAVQSESELDLLEERYTPGDGQSGGDSACRSDIAPRRAGTAHHARTTAGRRDNVHFGGATEPA